MRAWLFFIPYFISLYFNEEPEIKYWICWGGSFWIYLVTFMGWANTLPKDRTFAQQFMRPFIFVHLLCSGYMVLSSVFYFMHYHGYYYFEQVDVPDPLKIAQTAQCQQYYQLAHAALAMGLTFWMKDFEQKKYAALPKRLNAPLFLRLTLVTLALVQVVQFLPFGSAFKSNLSQLSLLVSLLFFIQAITEKKHLALAIGIFLGNIVLGTLSGMKSATLIIILFLGAHYFALYRWRVIVLGGAALWLWLIFIPTISYTVRKQSWFGVQNSTAAVRSAIAGIRENTVDPWRLNWDLLVFRSSEVGMFIRYVNHIPAKRDFYKFQLLDQALMGLLPRTMRPDGRSIDETAMERAIEVGIVDRKTDKSTSAKPALVADAYMSGAEWGIVITFFLFGFVATRLAKACESLFGGYLLGSVLIFNGCFSIFQTGNCFENIPSSILYGVVTMYFMFYLMLELKILHRINVRLHPAIQGNIGNL